MKVILMEINCNRTIGRGNISLKHFFRPSSERIVVTKMKTIENQVQALQNQVKRTSLSRKSPMDFL